MKVGLISLPLWSIDWPPLSLASLTAFLRKFTNYEVIQKDLNIEFFHSILTQRYLINLQRRINAQIEYLSSNGNGYHQIFNKLVIAQKKIEFLLNKVENIPSALKKPLTANTIEVKDHHLIREILEIISASFYPLSITLNNVLYNREPIKSKKVIEFYLDDERNNPFFKFTKKAIQHLFEEDQVNVFGLSVSTMDQLLASLTAAKLIKQRHPDQKVILGGSLIYYVSQHLVNWKILKSLIDFIIVGEGETPLKLLLDWLQKSDFPVEDVPNLIFKKQRRFEFSNYQQHIENVNQLPTPDFEDFNLEKYLAPEIELPILISRGCYWDKCSFCNICATYMNKYRIRDINLFKQDIVELQDRHNVKFFTFADECISPSRLKKISRIILQNKIEMYWDILARFEEGFLKEEDLFHTAYQAGCRMITFGLESASEKVLSKMNKGIKPEVAEKILRATSENSVWNNLFIFFGFPGETEEDRNITINFILKNSQYIHSHSASIFRLEKGSKVFRNPQKFEINITTMESDYIGTEQYFTYRDNTTNDELFEYVTNLPEILNKELPFIPKYMQGMNARNLKQYLSKHNLDFLSRIYLKKKSLFDKLLDNNATQKVSDRIVKIMNNNKIEMKEMVLFDNAQKRNLYYLCFCFNTSRFFVMSKMGVSIFEKLDNVKSYADLLNELTEEYSFKRKHLDEIDLFIHRLFQENCLSPALS